MPDIRLNITAEMQPRELSEICMALLASKLKQNWGVYSTHRRQLVFENGNRVLCRYSKLHDQTAQWFYGVPPTVWENWTESDYIAFMVPRGDELKYIMFTPAEAKVLLSKCGQDRKGHKKIHINYPAVGREYITEWQELPISDRIQDLSGNIEQ
jgi:hypothetical protein